jgi:ABC-type transport system involved in multi-copper enzyme maturation permease subunit
MNPLWSRQVRGILRLEFRKTLLSMRSVPIYLLGGLPVVVAFGMVAIFLLFEAPPEFTTTNGAAHVFAIFYHTFMLRFLVYFGCVWIFMNLFRGEVLDRSLHYYFLAPVRREVLVVGKFLSGWMTATLVFSASTVTTNVVLYSYFGIGPAADFLLKGAGFGYLLAYIGITALACLGYGAVFLVVGLFLRNPVVPALIFFFWESINVFLPATLKKISVAFYLNFMVPVPLPRGTLGIVADPVSPWLSVPGLMLFSALTLLLAAYRIRRMEIAYGTD